MNNMDEAFLDYLSYLAFMAAQLPWDYGPFALVKAIEKALAIKDLSGEIGLDELCLRLRDEYKTVEGTPSSETATWEAFLGRLTDLLTNEMMRGN